MNLKDLRVAAIRGCNSLSQQVIRDSFDVMVFRGRRCTNAEEHAFPDE